MPPAPMEATTSYAPNLVPGARAKGCGDYRPGVPEGVGATACEQPTSEAAKRAPGRGRQQLTLLNQSAATSRDQGLDETLALHRLGLFEQLGLRLKTTSVLESIHARWRIARAQWTLCDVGRRPQRRLALDSIARIGPLGTIGAPARFQGGALSPDGRRFVAAEVSRSSGLVDLLMIDLERNVSTRFTSSPGDERNPVWTPDSQSVVYGSNSKGQFDLVIKAAGGATPERVLLESADSKTPAAISRDGATLFYEVGGGRGGNRLWAVPMAGGKPFQVFPGSTDAQRSSTVSPDGKWIAYVSGPSNATNVFVQPYPPTGVRERISTTTGHDPHWTADGRQIVFVTRDDHIMVADITTTGGQLRVGLPRELFTQRIAGAKQFEMDATGQRFLLLVDPRSGSAAAPATPEPLTVVVNWLAMLGKP